MNEKNSLGLNLCFKEHNNPIKLFEEWFNKAKKTEINDPNAFAVGTVNIVVLSVDVKFIFLFINLLAIIVQRS